MIGTLGLASLAKLLRRCLLVIQCHIRFPAGYRFPVHWHPNSEHVTVLSGRLLLAMGNTADQSKLRSYGPGDFIYAPARMSHYGGAKTATVVQLNGTGPFAINLGVAPASK